MAELRPIPKPLALRVQDLLVALRVLRDLIGAVRAGRTYHMAPIYGQLRAVLTDAASGNTPLLPAVAEGVGYPLTVFAMAGVDEYPAELPEPTIHISAGAPSLHRSFPGHEEMTLAEYLDTKIIRWNGHTFSVKSVVEDFANTAGGAHYSKDLKQQVGWFTSLRLNDESAVVNGLLQIAEFTLALGTDIIRKVSGLMLLADILFVERFDDSPSDTS
jgi:hypothetical protein